MSEQAAALLKQHFGFDRFNPGQQEVIDHLLEGRSAAAVFPTGGGKSLCYQLPALALPGITLVVSPLIALMKDQIDALARRGIPAQRLDSTLDADGYRAAMDRVRSGDLRLLYVAPERFNNERFRQVLGHLRVSLFAVDEAHCISEWGHNFRPDYLKLAGYAKQAGAERVLALTATATPKVLDDIRQVFDIEERCAVRTGFYRPNLTLRLTPTKEHERDGVLLSRMRELPGGPTIVYVTLQRTAEQVARRLSEAGFAAEAYHAGMKTEDRTEVQDRFIHSEDGVVVATIAFGMGIDKADIRYVYHYNLPKSLENYSQEIGRAGRDGQPAACELFACGEDLSTLENFVYGDTPTAGAVGSLVRELFALGEEFDVGLYELSGEHDLRPLVARTLLTYLELLGYLEGGTPFYSVYQFQPLMPSKALLAQFEGERRAFLAGVLKHARKAKTWFHLDVDRAAAGLGVARDRIVAALDYLGEKQMLEVRAAGVRLRYRAVKRPSDEKAMAALIDKLVERTQRHEANEIARLGQVVELVEHDGCQVARLGAHFGEQRGPCGHCSWCLGDGSAAKMPPRTGARPGRGQDTKASAGSGPGAISGSIPRPVPGAGVVVDDGVRRRVAELRREHPGVLEDARAVARLLCGVSSPSLSRAKLTKDPLFGRTERVPFAAVMAAFEGDEAKARE